MSGVGKVVCVTGASGYIVSWLVKLLLEHGYTVKASVRDPNDPKKTEHLLALDGAKERLHLFKANLLEEGAFDSAISGCDGVFHTASPTFQSATYPQAEIIEPAVKGTLSILKSCSKAPSVKRVVITSSMVAVLFSGKSLRPDVVVDETWFSDPVICENLKHWYAVSKTLAEQAAWKFAKDNGIDLITILPGATLGPQTFPNRVYTIHDVRDVASAHIRAFEVASASGRYCLLGYVAHVSEALKILQQLYPALTIPEKTEDDQPLMPKYKLSDLKAKSLGINNFIPLEVSLRDTVESLKEKDDPTKTEHVLALDGAKERLHLFKANLLEEGATDSAIDGCDGAFHTASPVIHSAIDPQSEIIDPAMKATINVLRSCTKVPSIKIVVITSSMASVVYNGKHITPDVVVDETWFSDPRIFAVSKTLAEQAAWKFAKENGIELVTIHPGVTVGPLLQPTINDSVNLIMNLINVKFSKALLGHGDDTPEPPTTGVTSVSNDSSKAQNISSPTSVAYRITSMLLITLGSDLLPRNEVE
ncbi:NAD(P)-binding domain containing protein [Trema orientale]|uniref:NAD(P)-binding domain containing protein n=1 Tax=Trema orientale TaxID=63057 RepID=A0A2P5EH07_TREOI|nr:NAD(P)-binding domain containing protein [Trema orientale]